ncbi:DUF4241 domain-containing protein [Streptomyces sp. NPDC059787]|uniref:DUF4241 domain-containing protein n=1 Tax=Streptomyces sp. NPDC059787 TaxID=3346947 RepID=UPI00365F75E6
MPLTPPDFTALFTEGHRCTLLGGRPATVTLSESVDLALPTGRVVVCDPFTGLGPFAPRPFTAEVPPGRYSVTVATVSFDSDGTPARVAAAARLSVTTLPAATWELAVGADDDVADLGEGEFFGYETDHGDVCFVDGSAVPALADHEDRLNEALIAYATADFALPPVRATGPAGEEVVAFNTGRRRSGFYPTWVGRTGSGAVASFVTDFLVLDDPPGHDTRR